MPVADAMLEEQHFFNQSVALSTSKARMNYVLNVGVQSREWERYVNILLEKQDERLFTTPDKNEV
ncbi:MAG: hypothetical protein ACW99E_15840 [Promethearchaeota archaeon]